MDERKRKELIDERNKLEKGAEDYVFDRHLSYGKMIGVATISIGTIILFVAMVLKMWSLVPMSVICLVAGFISLTTNAAANQVKRLSIKDNNRQYENTLDNYQTRKAMQNKIALYTGLIGTIICIILYLLIVGISE